MLQRSVGRTSVTVSDVLFLGGAVAVAAVFFLFGIATFRERGDDFEVLVYSLSYFAVALAAFLVAVFGVVSWSLEWLRSRRTKT
jgi:hypothetical protein